MNRAVGTRSLVAILLIALMVASCGGGDDAGPDRAGTATDDQTIASENPGGTQPEFSDTDPEDPEPTDSAPSESGTGGDTPDCDAIFSIDEIEELFAEPAELTEETTESLGQLVCTWETIEDPESTDDFAFKLLIAQFFSGNPIPASSFFDPSFSESVVTIPGIGDLAYSSEDLGTSFNFVDDPVGGSLSYSEVDLGDTSAPKLRSRDDIEQLFRTFHERVT